MAETKSKYVRRATDKLAKRVEQHNASLRRARYPQGLRKPGSMKMKG